MYKSVIRPVLFSFDPESIHHTTFNAIKAIHALPGMGPLLKSWYRITDPRLETEVFGLKFPNPVGLAAGFDKDAKLYRELANFGFGFIEIGTLTPKPQPGNDKPRLFRLPQDKALINRMGFNNQGVEAAVARLKKRQPGLIIGGNIGKNKITPNEDAILDYELAFEALYPHVDYFVVNVSSPNTPNLRALQDKEPLTKLLRHLQNLRAQKSISKPILLKIAPDLNHGQLDDIAEMALDINLDGIIATNTTLSRDGLKTDLDRVKQIGMGGVSGKPVTQMSTEVIAHLGKAMNHKVPLVGVGGIFKPEDALQKLDAGASLVQVYTGFIYEGPGMVKRINKAILEKWSTVNSRQSTDNSPQ